MLSSPTCHSPQVCKACMLRALLTLDPSEESLSPDLTFSLTLHPCNGAMPTHTIEAALIRDTTSLPIVTWALYRSQCC